VLADVWMPAQRISPGTVLGATEVVTREVDLVRESRAVVADPSLFGRYEIARAASPDRPLTWNDLTARALVRKGQLVDVVANEGLLSVSMKGQATRSGALGEVVVIRNLQSKREFSAEVIDENKVRVRF
jgi:flagella basal body P-ring formation protein FlgA